MSDDFFGDLPNEEDGSSEKNKDEKKDADENEVKKRNSEVMRNLEKAKKDEERKIAELKKELAEKRNERKKIEKSEDVIDEESDEKKANEDRTAEVKKTVEEALKEKEKESRKTKIAMLVRKVSKSRQEAEAIFEAATKLPDDWEEEEVVRFGSERVQGLKDKTRGFVSPPIGGGGDFSDFEHEKDNSEDVEGVSKARYDYLKGLGWSKEDIKKYKDGPDLGRVWGDGKVLVNNR